LSGATNPGPLSRPATAERPFTEQSSADREPIERLVLEFLEPNHHQAGPALTECGSALAEATDETHERPLGLDRTGQSKSVSGDATGTFETEPRGRLGRIPERLGDFRIIREVGRGGMGIVYEAEQESLGRHVALKVLPSQTLLNPRYLQRFLREARAAARLHHTNIVPVFGVGEEDGLHYYVMQFIAGSGLDEVIDELRRLASAEKSTSENEATPETFMTRDVCEVARGLLTGRFEVATPEAASAGSFGGEPVVADVRATDPRVDGSPFVRSASGREFAHAVARVGLQVAQALGYAHGQGILHRDVKPSNLLLDVHGMVWVADFGLAKAMADTDGLTGEGDVLGTLRYMAPERFRGLSDARSDLYALGLTLYELLTLRPAFDQTERDRLIHQVTTEVPPRPRAINPEIPRDLETIVLKAIEHDPAKRYPDADELADDLQRFLADRPILARRVGMVERGWKWAQRKPAVAGLLAALALAVAAGFAGVTWQWRRAIHARDTARVNESHARRNFEHALETVNTFCTQVSEEQLLDEPGMHPLRRKLLELARRYYQTFQREQAADPTVKKELARTFFRYGVLTLELGDGAGARVALLRAKDISTELCRIDPNDVASRADLVRAYVALEDVYRLVDYGQNTTMVQFMPNDTRLCITLAERLVAHDPANVEYRCLLGRAYNALGTRQAQIVRFQAAEEAYFKAIEVLERARSLAPDHAENVGALVLAYDDLAFVYRQMGRHAASVRALERALGLVTEQGNRSPRSRRNRLAQAQSLTQLGTAFIDLGCYEQSEERLDDAAKRLTVLLSEDAEPVEVRYWANVARTGLGRLALARGRVGEAEASLRSAVAIYERAPAESLAVRDLVGLGWSYIWLAWSRHARWPPGESHQLADKLAEVPRAIEHGLLAGQVMSLTARAIAQLKDQIELLRLAQRAATPSNRISVCEAAVRAWQIQVAKRPENLADRFELAWSKALFAESLVEAGRAADAKLQIDAAMPAMEDLTSAEPGNLHWRQGLCRVWEVLARLQGAAGREAESRDSAGKALAIARDLARTDPAYFYDLACALCLHGRLFSSVRDLEEGTEVLDRAIKEGFDDDHRLRTDFRLDGLRRRVVAAPPGSPK
jgi:serine/threonine-protein kinase